MLTKAIIYAPFLDFLLLQEFLAKGQKIDPHAKFIFKPQTNWHKDIGKLAFGTIPKETSFFAQDSMIASSDEEDIENLEEFLKKHSIGLPVPKPEPSETSRVKNFTAVAFMQLFMQWPEKYKADDQNYSCDDVKEVGQKKTIKGFRLGSVSIGMSREDIEVIAKINLDDKFSILLADVSAFSDTVQNFEQELATPFELYRKITEFKAYYWEPGTVYAPNVTVDYCIKNHLSGIEYNTEHERLPDDWIEKIIIQESEQVAKLELSKHGIKARAEAYARGSMLIGCAVSYERQYHLSVTRGLIVAICYENQPLFVAYVPQNCFQFV